MFRVEQRHRAAVRDLVERHRQLEIIGTHSDGRAGDRHPLAVAGELKFGQFGLQLLERNTPIREDEHPSARDAAMHTSRHLQQLVRAQVYACEHVAPLVDHVGEARVVDDHRIQPLHGDRTLAGRRHREEERLAHAAFVQVLTDHADRFAAVIVLRMDLGIALLHVPRGILGPGARRQEHRHTATVGNHLLEELVVEEIRRTPRQHFDLRLLRFVEAVDLEHGTTAQVLRVERGIDRRRQPDEPAARPLAERQAELELRRRLVDLIHDHGVVRIDVAILEPPPGDAGGDDDHVALRRLGCRLAFAIHDTDAQRLAEDRLGNRTHRERLAGARAGDDAEALTTGRQLA